MPTLLFSPLRGLVIRRECKTKRESSWDRTGGNDDRLHIAPKSKATLANIKGAGCITHFWCTVSSKEELFLRKIILRMFWDGEREPSVEVPLGDFFGIGHGITKNFASLPLCMSPRDGRGFSCYFPMPFAKEAKVEIESECEKNEVLFYYYLDYEVYNSLPTDHLRFHAQWRRERCKGISEAGMTNDDFLFGGRNLTGEGNYIILDGEGEGHYVGCVLNIHNLRNVPPDVENWYGEGDDMIFVDGELFPPSFHGTGTEDYFNCAWSPQEEFYAPYHGITLGSGQNWSGKVSWYRFHIEDPIVFKKSILVTIEHGHANRRSDDYSSTAYWYQSEPHKKFPPMPPVEQRLPIGDNL
ncbi:MAG: glycoside hydrolase family 172 protein [Candidatus Edwardsbacteria bacterium]